MENYGYYTKKSNIDGVYTMIYFSKSLEYKNTHFHYSNSRLYTELG